MAGRSEKLVDLLPPRPEITDGESNIETTEKMIWAISTGAIYTSQDPDFSSMPIYMAKLAWTLTLIIPRSIY